MQPGGRLKPFNTGCLVRCLAGWLGFHEKIGKEGWPREEITFVMVLKKQDFTENAMVLDEKAPIAKSPRGVHTE